MVQSRRASALCAQIECSGKRRRTNMSASASTTNSPRLRSDWLRLRKAASPSCCRSDADKGRPQPQPCASLPSCGTSRQTSGWQGCSFPELLCLALPASVKAVWGCITSVSFAWETPKVDWRPKVCGYALHFPFQRVEEF